MTFFTRLLADARPAALPRALAEQLVQSLAGRAVGRVTGAVCRFSRRYERWGRLCWARWVTVEAKAAGVLQPRLLYGRWWL
jgi:hypothetical protein